MAEATGSSGGQGSGGGAGIYLIGFLVLAAAIVGIFFATRSKDSGGASTATVAATQEPTAPKKLSGPAPPAPPEDDELDEEPSASASASASAAPSASGKAGPNSGVAGSGDNSACSKCGKGKSSGALESKVRSVAGSAQGCYNRALRTSAASGTLVVAVSVGAGGASCGASIVSDSVGNAEISSCVLGRFQGQSWPAPDEGCVTVSVPINFKIAN